MASLEDQGGGLVGTDFQHEIDHINGILYTDRTNDIWQPDEDDEDIPDV